MLEADKNTFEEEVLKADGYVLVDFTETAAYLARRLCRMYTRWQMFTEIS